MSKSKNKAKNADKQPEERADDAQPQENDLQSQVDKLSEDLKRAQADFVNFKRRNEQTQSKRFELMKIDLVKSILPVVDDLERAAEHRPDELKDNSWADGVDAILKQLQKVLTTYGVERIDTVGQPFDPNLHEAVSVEGDGSQEVITEELQPGYLLSDNIIRHAMVKVEKSR